VTRTRIERLDLSELHIPFRTTFRHASAERSRTSSIWVEATSNGRTGRGESCPRPYVTADNVRDWAQDMLGLLRLAESEAAPQITAEATPMERSTRANRGALFLPAMAIVIGLVVATVTCSAGLAGAVLLLAGS
jgi:hypothetical protein